MIKHYSIHRTLAYLIGKIEIVQNLNISEAIFHQIGFNFVQILKNKSMTDPTDPHYAWTEFAHFHG